MNNIDLSKMPIEELKNLMSQIKSEIDSRNNKPNLVLYTHDCKTAANYHKGKYKHWSKLVKSIDITKTNGYAFQGEFLNIDYEHKVPSGSIVVEVCGSKITAYKISDKPEKLLEAQTNSMSKFIEKIAEML